MISYSMIVHTVYYTVDLIPSSSKFFKSNSILILDFFFTKRLFKCLHVRVYRSDYHCVCVLFSIIIIGNSSIKNKQNQCKESSLRSSNREGERVITNSNFVVVLDVYYILYSTQYRTNQKIQKRDNSKQCFSDSIKTDKQGYTTHTKYILKKNNT